MFTVKSTMQVLSKEEETKRCQDTVARLILAWPFQKKVHIDKCAPPEGESSRNIRYTVVIAAAQRVQGVRSPGSARHRRRFQCARPAPIAN